MKANIVFTIDVDDDYCNSNYHKKIIDLEWNSIPYCKKLSNLLSKHNIPITFFVRCDEQIEYFYNKKTYIFEQYLSIWKDLINQGNEIGFHSHIVEFKNNSWTNQDLNSALNNLNNSLLELYNFPIKITSSRISGFPKNQHINEILIKNGIKHDSSCFPGFKKIYPFSEKWQDNKSEPFLINSNLDINKSLIEVPLSVINSKMSYDKDEKLRYLNPSFRFHHFNKLLENYIKKVNQNYPQFSSHTYNFILHPDEMNSKIHNKNHELYFASFKNVVSNIYKAIDLFSSYYSEINLIKLSEIKHSN